MIHPDPEGTPEERAEYRRLLEKDREAVLEQYKVKPDLVLDTTIDDVRWLRPRHRSSTK